MTDKTKSLLPVAPAPADRRAFLRRTALGLAGLTAAGTAAAAVVPPPQLRLPLRQIQGHENEHVSSLTTALGAMARPKPTFQSLEQSSIGKFLAVALALENTGVGAYLGAAPAIDSMAFLAAAGSIALIEARHAGFLNYARGRPVTGGITGIDDDNDFEMPLTTAEVRALAGPFVSSLNGGPPLEFSTNPMDFGPVNDVAILNFALALEYLEAEFYNINVPKFYR